MNMFLKVNICQFFKQKFESAKLCGWRGQREFVSSVGNVGAWVRGWRG